MDLTNIIGDEMDLNKCSVQLDTNSGYYVTNMSNVPLHGVINGGCDVATLPVMFEDKTLILFPPDIAGIYLYKNMDTQMLMTYDKYYGKRGEAYELGNIEDKTLRDEITHIVDNNLSNIVAYGVKPESYFIDLTFDDNISKILSSFDKMVNLYKSGKQELPETIKNYFSANPTVTFSALRKAFVDFTGHTGFMRSSSKLYTTTIHIDTPITIRHLTRTEDDNVSHTMLNDNMRLYEQMVSERNATLSNNMSEQSKLINSFKDDMDLRFDNIKTKSVEFEKYVTDNDDFIKHLLETKSIQDYSIIYADFEPGAVIRFKTKNGGLVLFNPVKDGYDVYTQLKPKPEKNLCKLKAQSDCELCNVAYFNALLQPSSYKLGTTSILKYFNIRDNDSVVKATAMVTENIDGKSCYLEKDDDERILSFPYTHGATHQPCRNKSHSYCGLHTYYCNGVVEINDRMLFNMLETLNASLAYAYNKYGVEFTIGEINYDVYEGVYYNHGSTRKPTIYPMFHTHSNSIGHVHLHTWICKSGNGLMHTINLCRDSTHEVNNGAECITNVFGCSQHEMIAPISAPDPFYSGGSFEFTFKKMLGIQSKSVLMSRKLFFRKPLYDLHKNCYINNKQKFHDRQMILTKSLNKLNFLTNPVYTNFTQKIRTNTYTLPTTFVKTKQHKCNIGIDNTFITKQHVAMVIKIATPTYGNIAGYFTRTVPTHTMIKTVKYIKHPEICLISTSSGLAKHVTNSKYSTCSDNNIQMLINHICTTICTYHKTYTLSVDKFTIQIGKLWEDVLTSVSKKSKKHELKTQKEKFDHLHKLLGFDIDNTVETVLYDLQFGGSSGIDVMRSSATHALFEPKTQHVESTPISNSTKMLLFNINRQYALSQLTENDIYTFVSDHYALYDHDGTVDVFFSDTDCITINARDICAVMTKSFVEHMKNIMLYHHA